jgi:acetyl-CoA carboxylase biotin carboxyl carrier protein
MELKEIEALVKLISNSKVDEVLIEKKDFKINIKKHKKETKYLNVSASPAPAQATFQQPVAPVQSPKEESGATATKAVEAPLASNLIEIKSPMIGTFYRKASPDKPNFVEVGDSVENGKVVCIIEAMKLFNEIESEISGKIVKVLVDDATPVEYDQPLFLVEPA